MGELKVGCFSALSLPFDCCPNEFSGCMGPALKMGCDVRGKNCFCHRSEVGARLQCDVIVLTVPVSYGRNVSAHHLQDPCLPGTLMTDTPASRTT